ncbi:putative E3 ubiquitin-protein ligase ariadne-2 isoform X1 [Anarhichas minor]|uniref:putative E3 ubiquitin-protein ligase ariadne-2 isoform X1 n=1 Tax=Anarhichas minor TaxID=65739 RepID=UPI003F73C0E3
MGNYSSTEPEKCYDPQDRTVKCNDKSLGVKMESKQEKCYDPQDGTLTFVNGEDDLDFFCNDYKSLRAKMSCGHAVTPMSLTHWCRRQLDEGECRFVCGQPGCDVEWKFDEVCKMALLTPEEMKYFEKKMFSNAAKDFLKVKSCPGCQCRVVRTDLCNLSVQCTVCTADKKRTFIFCWQCLREWKGPAPCSGWCGNDDCNNPLKTLTTCSDITFEDVRGVTGCPSVRACPTCGLLVEHNTTQCKNVVCGRCKVGFCFVCLKLTEECLRLKPSSYCELCSTGVAPRQTSIPVWQRT